MLEYRRTNVPRWKPCLHSAPQLPTIESPAAESPVEGWILWRIFAT